MRPLLLVKLITALASFAGVGQLTALATGHAWGPWSDRPAGAHSHGWPGSGGHGPHPATCVADSPAGPEQALASGDAVQTVALGVPRTALLDIDPRGKVVSAWTNTGCPPAAGDGLWQRRADGSLTAVAPTALRGITWHAVPGEPGTYTPKRSH